MNAVTTTLSGGFAVRTSGEIEAAVCEGISRFKQDYMGRGPKDVHTYLVGDLAGSATRRGPRRGRHGPRPGMHRQLPLDAGRPGGGAGGGP